MKDTKHHKNSILLESFRKLEKVNWLDQFNKTQTSGGKKVLSNPLIGDRVYLFLTSLSGSVPAQEVQADKKHLQTERYVFFFQSLL